MRSRTLQEAERYKRLFVDPAVKALGDKLESQLAPILKDLKDRAEKDEEQDKRITALESKQTKALVGYSVFASVLGVALAAALDRLKRMFS